MGAIPVGMAVRNMKEVKLSTDTFLPLTEAEQQVVPSHLTYKILKTWNEDAHDWLEDQLVFDQDWFSMTTIGNLDYEYYYFRDRSDAVRFMITWP